jgi:hypothetical protein
MIAKRMLSRRQSRIAGLRGRLGGSRPVRRGPLLAVGGAVLAYFLDPASGKRRRHGARDRVAATFRRGGRRAARQARRASAEAYGVAQKAAHTVTEEEPPADDITLARKVETKIFRPPDVPKGKINVNVENGVVYLRGEADTPEQIRELEAAVREIPGVTEVENLLHLPGTPARSKE